MKLPKIEESPVSLKLFCLEGSSVPFIPWQRNERGQQVFIKLTRAEEVALLFVGENCLLDAELQQTLIRLVNEGWKVEGELTASFEGSHEPGIDPYVYQDPIVLELGKGLLPLLDPQQGAPLLGALPQVRDEIARESGLVPAGVRLKDNLRLGANQYTVLLKSSPIASGEIYLDRFLAIGSFEQLSALEGWATVEPTYRMQAKWVSADLQEKAKKMGCTKLGILATTGTVASGTYQAVCEAEGLQWAVPSPARQSALMEIIYCQIKQGQRVDMARFMEIADELRAAGCQQAVLGCTELSLIKRDEGLDSFFLDSTEVLAKETLAVCGKPSEGFSF